MAYISFWLLLRQRQQLDLHVVAIAFHNPASIVEQQILINPVHVDAHILVIIILVSIGWQAQAHLGTPILPAISSIIGSVKYSAIKPNAPASTANISKNKKLAEYELDLQVG